jgi:guanylate kinase
MRALPPRRGIIFILSAPSGAGKTTIWRAARPRVPDVEFSVSLTTRARRENEVDGVDYHFVTDAEFTKRIERGEMAEWAHVFDHRSGTPKAPLENAIRSGRDILVEIDVQGERQLRPAYPDDAVSIFVMPPSFRELEERLRSRGTESEAAIQRRLKTAREEMKAYPFYDYLIINDDLDEAVERLLAMMKAETSRIARLREGFAPWNS